MRPSPPFMASNFLLLLVILAFPPLCVGVPAAPPAETTTSTTFGHAAAEEARQRYYEELNQWRLAKHGASEGQGESAGEGELGLPEDEVGAEIKRIQEEA
jgi:hypothetical protein